MLRLHTRLTQMFDVGFAEVFLLGVIGLLVLGPERLPAVARTLGGLMRKARASWASLRTTIEAELAEADIAKPIKQMGDELKQIGKDLKSDLPDMNTLLKPGSKSPEEQQTTLATDGGSDSENKIADIDESGNKKSGGSDDQIKTHGRE